MKCSNGVVISERTSSEDVVDLNLFLWGTVGNQLKNNISLDSFMKHTFGGLVFRPIK